MDTEDREQILGFRPQREISYNKLLPYGDQLDAESTSHLAEIKAYLGRTIQLRDIKIGATHWTGQLSKYIRLYGHKFSKEDHINFIHLLFDMTTLPDLELPMVSKFGNLLIVLLKKRELLSRDDLILPWRPLYELLEKVAFNKFEHHGLQVVPRNLDHVLKCIIKECRLYFPLEATAEMLEEWRPLLCPYDMTMIKATMAFSLFLPTYMPLEHQDKGYKLWFDDFVTLWDTCQNNPSWEGSMISLFTRLAFENIGYIDWEPYMSKIFSRILRSFNLPVGGGKIRINHHRGNNGYELVDVAWLIVSMMGGGSSCQQHLTKLFQALETFFHPSNYGKWIVGLMRLMVKLSQNMVKRVFRERGNKHWGRPIPDSHKLTNEEITAFVESIKPIVFLAMFSKLGSHDSSLAINQLASLRPELIIPPLLEKTYPALETLTEPHRLIACLNCTVAVARTMLSSHKWYPEGRSHVLPLLNLSLPGIDPNDIRKCLTTFQLISTLVSLVPLVDCSDAINSRTDLTETERELCSATAQFEDFIMLFLDKLFGLIENSSGQYYGRSDTGLNHEEAMMEVGLLSTINAVMQQASPALYDEALKKLFRFVSTSFYEIRVSGRYASDMCRAASKADPHKSLKLFVPHFCRILIARTSNEEVAKEEHLDNEILWNLKLLSEVVRCDGKAILPYKDSLMEVLQLTLHLKCKEAADIASNLLKHVLKALTLIYNIDYRSCPQIWDESEDVLSIREWGKPGDVNKLKLKWHVPTDEEIDFASEVVNKFLGIELDRINKHITGQEMTREELAQCLKVVVNVVIGAGSELPEWPGEQIQLVESVIELKRYHNISGSHKPGIQINGQNTRLLIANTVRPLLDYMLANGEDDTKSLFQVIRVYSSIVFYQGTLRDDFDGRWKSLHIVKKSMENKLMGKKKHIRAVLVDRVQLQHELRVINRTAKIFTPLHRDLFHDLFRLSISRYSEVRKSAQNVLNQGFNLYSYSYRSLLSEVLRFLQEDPSIEHHQFKGALHVVLGEQKRSLVTKRSWEVMGKVWPALIQAQHSEKPSIIRLIDGIADKLHKNMEATELSIKVPDSLVKTADSLWQGTVPQPTVGPASVAELQHGKDAETQRNDKTLRDYLFLVNELVRILEPTTLHWRYQQIGMEMLFAVARHDILLPADAVQLFTNNIINDTLQMRKISISAVAAILKQQKRPHLKELFDPYAISGSKPPDPGTRVPPGVRPDNNWMQYTSADKVFDSKENWDKTVFMDKTHWGYACWPTKMYKYAPAEKQPALGRSLEEVRPEERPILQFFQDATKVEQLMNYLSLEENKGKDKFNSRIFSLWKGLFRSFDDTVLTTLRPHVERLLADTKHDTHEISQRCAMEVIAGMIRGCKHWTYEKMKAMWEWLIPLLQSALSNMTVESIVDWGTCFATASESRDPKKLGPLIELLMESPLSGDGGSFGDSSRLYILQGALAQQEWRVAEPLQKLYSYMTQYLTHPYKNVRDRLGSFLVNLFMYDFPLPYGAKTNSPRVADFTQMVLPSLEILKQPLSENNETSKPESWFLDQVHALSVLSATSHSDGKKPTTSGASQKPDNSPKSIEMMDLTSSHDEESNDKLKNKTDSSPSDDSDGENEERKTAIKLCKTVMKWLQGSYIRMFHTSWNEFYEFLPILCMLESETKDDEVRTESLHCLACMAQSQIDKDMVPHLLTIVQQVLELGSWHARSVVLGFLQVLVFSNLFIMFPHTETIRTTVMQLLCDDQLEVREMAAVTLGGFLHCGFLTLDKDMLTKFEKLSRTKIKRKKQVDGMKPELLIKRHAGVLGLSACVQAFPYDVPEFIPQILMDLSDHLDDPQPIQLTVKKTLSNFRRTHHDNWQDHKQKFTDDQLVVLTDLLVSPSYYA